MAFEKDFTIAILVDPDYKYEVKLGDKYCIRYVDSENDIDISFGSLEEMREVAEAMLTLCKVYKDVK